MSRKTIARATAAGPMSLTRSAPAEPVGNSWSAASTNSASSRNGLPPVASRQAAANSSDTFPPSLRSHSRVVASALSGGGRSTRVSGAAARRLTSSAVPLARAGTRQERHGEPVEPRREEVEEPQRLGVRPVQVVDAERHGRVVGDVVQQPVEPVEHRERVVGRTGAERNGVRRGGLRFPPRRRRRGRARHPRAGRPAGRAAAVHSRTRSRAPGRSRARGARSFPRLPRGWSPHRAESFSRAPPVPRSRRPARCPIAPRRALG